MPTHTPTYSRWNTKPSLHRKEVIHDVGFEVTCNEDRHPPAGPWTMHRQKKRPISIPQGTPEETQREKPNEKVNLCVYSTATRIHQRAMNLEEDDEA